MCVRLPFGADIVFKGGTSLAKAYHAIRRFSEDIDVTYDIRVFAPDLVTGAGPEALPPTRSQEQRWSKAIRLRLADWVRDQSLPAVAESLGRAGFQPSSAPPETVCSSVMSRCSTTLGSSGPK